MELHQYEELLEQIDALIESLNEHEGELYVAVEIAHHLRDEVVQVEPEASEDDE
jgi:hypothetical protein